MEFIFKQKVALNPCHSFWIPTSQNYFSQKLGLQNSTNTRVCTGSFIYHFINLIKIRPIQKYVRGLLVFLNCLMKLFKIRPIHKYVQRLFFFFKSFYKLYVKLQLNCFSWEISSLWFLCLSAIRKSFIPSKHLGFQT